MRVDDEDMVMVEERLQPQADVAHAPIADRNCGGSLRRRAARWRRFRARAARAAPRSASALREQAALVLRPRLRRRAARTETTATMTQTMATATIDADRHARTLEARRCAPRLVCAVGSRSHTWRTVRLKARCFARLMQARVLPGLEPLRHARATLMRDPAESLSQATLQAGKSRRFERRSRGRVAEYKLSPT